MGRQEFSMPPFTLQKWFFLSAEHLSAKDKWVAFSCNGADRDSHLLPLTQHWLMVRLWSFANARTWEWSFVLWGKKAACNAVLRVDCTWRRVRFHCSHCSLNGSSSEPPAEEKLGFKGWCCKAKANMKRIQISVHYTRIFNGSWTRNKANKAMSGLNTITYFNSWNFGLR